MFNKLLEWSHPLLGTFNIQLVVRILGIRFASLRLSASSCIFTLLLAGVFTSEAGDKITLSKIFAVCFNFSGVVLVSYSDIKDQMSHSGGGDSSGNLPMGVVWALLGAFFYSAYIVLLRRKVQVC